MGDSYTIQISSNLIDRLVNDETKTKRTQKVKPTKPKTRKPVDEDTSKDKRPSSSGGWPLSPPTYLSVPQPQSQFVNTELEAIKSVLQESEKVLDKLQKHEDQMVDELAKRAKELRDKEFKLPYQKPVPCLEERTACLKCYENHLRDPLKCANVVKRFADCAREARRETSLTAE